MAENPIDRMYNFNPQRMPMSSLLMMNRLESLLLTILDVQEHILEQQGMPKEEVQEKVSQLLSHYSGPAGMTRLGDFLDQVNEMPLQ